MPHERYDAIVIGTGQAGPALAVRLAGAGMSVAIVERHRFGGTCVNTGCIPTKTLVASAYAAQLARRAALYGVTIDGGIAVDMKRVKARKDEVAGNSSKGVESWLRGTSRVTVIEGHARFESPQAVRVSAAGPPQGARSLGGRRREAPLRGDHPVERVLQAPRIFVNVGARAFVPPLPGLAGVPYFTNSSIMGVDFVPPHLVIVGGSYIGLEFGQMYRRFGSRVTVVEKMPRILAREDADVADGVRAILEGEGVAVETAAECMAVAKAGDEIALDLDCQDRSRAVRGTHLLLALGRTPNTDDLGLDRAGVATDARGHIVVDDALQTGVPGIWALGECNGRGAFTHTAYNDYEIVADNLLAGAVRSVRDRIDAYALFVDPPLGRAGMSDDAIRKSGRRALVGKRPMTRVGRAVEKGETQGFMKIAVDADSNEILGAAILGVGGDEAVHCVLDLMYAKAPYTAMKRMVHIHPTVAEILPTLLGELVPLA